MFTSLGSVSDEQLRTLAAALRAGRLRAPFSSLSLQRYVSADAANAVAEDLEQATQSGSTEQQLALLLEAVAADRAARGPSIDEAIDLVCTGPEAPGTAIRDTATVVRELFQTAEKEVLVVGYAVHQGREVFRALAERMDERPELQVKMFLDVQRAPGDTSADSEVLHRFAHRFKSKEWPGSRLPEIYFDPRSLSTDPATHASLHAKCIVVDRSVAFVSSANFTGAGQTKNIELGILVRSARLADRLSSHMFSLTSCGELKEIRER